MPEIPSRDAVEASTSAVTPTPAENLNEMHEFVFKEALQNLETARTLDAAHRNWPRILDLGSEQRIHIDGNLVTDLTIAAGVPQRHARSLPATSREANAEAVSLQSAAAQSFEAVLVICLEEQMQIARMDDGEIVAVQVARLALNVLAYLLHAVCDQIVGPEKQQDILGEERPRQGWRR